jgi:hypothetical protein
MVKAIVPYGFIKISGGMIFILKSGPVFPYLDKNLLDDVFRDLQIILIFISKHA